MTNGTEQNANVNNLINMVSGLIDAWNRKPVNLTEIGKLLENLKLKLVECQVDFLPSKDDFLNETHINVARTTLEIGALWAIEMKNKDLFERYMAQLKSYYLDYSIADASEPPYKAQLLGLNLMRLLSENKLADFHTELELLKGTVLYSNIYISNPIKIEQYMMEGRYNKIFLMQNSVPAANYNFFMNTLLETIRNEIAECIEKAYETLSIVEAMRMLNLNSETAMHKYAHAKNWIVQGNKFVFIQDEKIEDKVPVSDLAEKTIEYARELEQIV